MSNSEESTVALCDLGDAGKSVLFSPDVNNGKKHTLKIITPNKKKHRKKPAVKINKDATVIECEREGRVFRMPQRKPTVVDWQPDPTAKMKYVDGSKTWKKQKDWDRAEGFDYFDWSTVELPEMQKKVYCCAAVTEFEGPEEHECSSHFPYSDRCPICIQARLTARSAFRIDKELNPSPTDEYQVSIDLGDLGVSNPDCDGNRWIFYGVEGHTDWGHAEPIGSKSSTITKEELEKFVNEIRQRCGPNVKIKIRCHSDEGTEFQGDCLEFIRSEGWKRTTTGPYTHSVPLVDNRIRKTKECAKAALLQATGGDIPYTKLLCGQATKHANRCINTRAWNKKRKSPQEKLTGKPYKLNKHDHIFGSLCYFFVPPEQREFAAYEQSARMGVWCGLEDSLSGAESCRVCEIKWDTVTKRWEIGKSRKVTRVKVESGTFPLRSTKELAAAKLDKFNEMMDELIGGAPVYKVTEIVGKRITSGGEVRYKCKWEGFTGTSEEPARALIKCGAADLVSEWEDTHNNSVLVWQSEEPLQMPGTAMAAKDDQDKSSHSYSYSIDQIKKLMRKQKKTGNPWEYKAAAEKEVGEVRRRRLLEVSKEVAKEVRERNLAGKPRRAD